jgi:hypothetical protein
VPPVRVLIFPLPRLLRDILHLLLSDVDEAEVIEVVDHPVTPAGLVTAAAMNHADVVIACERDAQPEAARALLRAMPRTRALAVSRDGRSGVIYELRPHCQQVSELSAATVRSMVVPAASCSELLRIDPTTRPAH